MHMSTLQKIELLLPKMTREEKALLLQWMVSELSGVFPGIEKTPGVCGGDARITRTRIPVWSLVSSQKSGMSDQELLSQYSTLTADDLRNAWNYYRANREEVENQIQENEVA